MKKMTSLLLAVLLLSTFTACASRTKAPDPGEPLVLADFLPYVDGKAGELPANGARLDATQRTDAATLRGVVVGDEATALATAYGNTPCDIDYYDEDGKPVNLNRATMAAFVHENQPQQYTATYLLLEVDGKTYAYDQLEDAPEEDEASAFTFYYLLFDIEDGMVNAIIIYTHEAASAGVT